MIAQKLDRNKSIDVLKGILILMVVFGHIVYAMANYAAISPTGWVYMSADYISTVWIAPYYMAAFFIITGYCSSFSRTIREQFLIDFQRLIIPSIIIPVIMSIFTICPICPVESFKNALLACIHLRLPWFLMALFVSKLVFKVTINLRWNWSFYLILSLVGVFMMNQYEHNYLSIFQALVFTLFVAIGFKAKAYVIKKTWIWYALFTYCAIIISFHLSGEFVVPALCGMATFNTSLLSIFILLATSGTLIWFIIAKSVSHSKFLEYLGKNSLIIYLTHFAFLKLVCILLKEFIQAHNGEAIPSLFIFLLLFCGATLWSLLWTYIFQVSFLRWIVGK